MSQVVALPHREWHGAPASDAVAAAHAALEHGDVVFCPELRFAVEPNERALFTPAILGSAKNASYDPAADRLGGTTVTGAETEALPRLHAALQRPLPRCVDGCCRRTAGRWLAARASFRPAEIAGRVTSWRKDDTRLHVDSFPATPSGGRRILRVFTNVNPDGRPRSWRIGDDFEAVARRFADRLRMPLPGSGRAARCCG